MNATLSVAARRPGLLTLAAVLLLSSACATAPTRTPPPPPTPATIGPAERWIEVDLAAQQVRLHDGPRLVAEYSAATGVGTTPETTTYPGLFEVCIMMRGPIESAPGVFVCDVVEFDLEHHNGFHSLPTDAAGKVLDPTLGQPVTAGCVRLAESATLFGFARVGMKVWVHEPGL